MKTKGEFEGRKYFSPNVIRNCDWGERKQRENVKEKLSIIIFDINYDFGHEKKLKHIFNLLNHK
jgi:hypothetical protein